MSFSDLPWWGWLLGALLVYVVTFYAASVAYEKNKRGWLGFWNVLNGIAVITALLLGMFGVVSWAWGRSN